MRGNRYSETAFDRKVAGSASRPPIGHHRRRIVSPAAFCWIA